MSKNESWTILDDTNHHDEPDTHAGSICLSGPNDRGIFYVFKIEPNGCYATTEFGYGDDKETVKAASRELAELVVKVLNRELPEGKLRVRRKGAKNG